MVPEQNEMGLDKEVLDGCLVPIEEVPTTAATKDPVLAEDVEETAQAEE